MQPELLIDGGRFCDYDGFVAEFNRACLAAFGGPAWDGEDFNDLDDLLEAAGGRLTIRWVRSRKSASDLGHEAMARFWSRALAGCRARFPRMASLHEDYQEKVDRATAGQGPTLFDWLAAQFRDSDAEVKLD
jgi:hypothetical protein